MKLFEVVHKPMITERTLQKAKNSVYTFYVDRNATKHQIASAVKKLFAVEIASVRTAVRKGKIRKTGKKMIKTRLSNSKIASIKVTKGKIDLFPQT